MHMVKEIGKIIREKREILEINQKDLAEIAGIALRNLIKIENGKANPSLATLLKVFDVLGLKIEIRNKT